MTVKKLIEELAALHDDLGDVEVEVALFDANNEPLYGLHIDGAGVDPERGSITIAAEKR